MDDAAAKLVLGRESCAAEAPAAAARRFVPYLLGFIGLVGTLPGCSVWYQARRTLVLEPRQFAVGPENAAAFRKYRRWANEALGEVAASDPEAIPSRYYEEGFVEGFTDFVFAGGDGQPPPIPPRRFWRLQFRDADGEQAIADWTAGFRHGTHIAQEGGYRFRAVVPPTHLLVGDGRGGNADGYGTDPTSEIWEPLREAPFELSPPPSAAPTVQPTGPTLAEPMRSGPALDQLRDAGQKSMDSPEPPANLLPPFEPSPAESTPRRNPALDQLPTLEDLPNLDNLTPAEEANPADQAAPPPESLFPDSAIEPSGGLQLNGPARRVSHTRQPTIDTGVAAAAYFETAPDEAHKTMGTDPFAQLETTPHEPPVTMTMLPEPLASPAAMPEDATNGQPPPPAELRLLDAINVSPLPVPSAPEAANLNHWERLFVVGEHDEESGGAAAGRQDHAISGVRHSAEFQTDHPAVKDGPAAQHGPLLKSATAGAVSPASGAALIIADPLTSASTASWQPAKNSWQPVATSSASNSSPQPAFRSAGFMKDGITNAEKTHTETKSIGSKPAGHKTQRDEINPHARNADDDPFLNPFGDK